MLVTLVQFQITQAVGEQDECSEALLRLKLGVLLNPSKIYGYRDTAMCCLPNPCGALTRMFLCLSACRHWHPGVRPKVPRERLHVLHLIEIGSKWVLIIFRQDTDLSPRILCRSVVFSKMAYTSGQ